MRVASPASGIRTLTSSAARIAGGSAARPPVP
jgi:hypothetical protein